MACSPFCKVTFVPTGITAASTSRAKVIESFIRVNITEGLLLVASNVMSHIHVYLSVLLERAVLPAINTGQFKEDAFRHGHFARAEVLERLQSRFGYIDGGVHFGFV